MKLLLSYFLLSAAALFSRVANGNICEPFVASEYHKTEYAFPDMIIPCPEVGKRVNVEYQVTLPENVTSIRPQVAVYHDGNLSVEGLSVAHHYGYRWEPGQQDVCDDLEQNYDDFFFADGSEVRTGCREDDNDLSWCESTPHSNDEKNITAVFSIWNSGGCEGNLHFEAIVGNDGAEIKCRSLKQVCPGVNGGKPGPYYNTTAMAMALNSSICGEQDDRHTSHFPELHVPCPGAGKKIDAAFSFLGVVDGGASVRVRARHEGKDPVTGIQLGHHSLVNSCGDIEEDYNDIFFDSKKGTGSEKLSTSPWSTLSDPLMKTTEYFSVWDVDGTCEGNLILEAEVKNLKFEVPCVDFELVCGSSGLNATLVYNSEPSQSDDVSAAASSKKSDVAMGMTSMLAIALVGISQTYF